MKLVLKLLQIILVYSLVIIFSTLAFFRFLAGFAVNGSKFFYVKKRYMPKCLRNPELGEHCYLKLSKVKIHYVEAGNKSKPLMLFVHGFPEFWYSWRYQMKEFAKDYWVVACDLRGYGNSDKPEGIHNYAMPDLVNDLKELIQGLGRQSCIVAAHDWGAALAWSLTIQHPEVVDKLIIMDVAHPLAFMKHLRSSLKQLLMSYYIFIFQVPWLPEALVRCNDLEIFSKTIRSQIYFKDSFTDEDVEAFKYTFSQPGALTPPINYYRNIMRAFGERLDRKNLSKIQVPVLIIWGEKDIALDPKMAYMSANYVENCTVHVIPEVGHWVQQDAHQLVNGYMRDFLKAKKVK